MTSVGRSDVPRRCTKKVDAHRSYPYASRPRVVGTPETGEDRHRAHDVAVGRGADHLALPDVDANVGDPVAGRVGLGEEDEVAGPQPVDADPSRRVVLLLGGAREAD